MSPKVIVATFALLLSAFFSTTAAAAPAPKVAFVGDWLTDGWSATFPANWINEGDCCNMGDYTAGPITAAIALKPSLIHIMIGSAYWDDDASYNLVTAIVIDNLVQMVTQAQAAGIPVVLGIEPTQVASGPECVCQAGAEVYAVALKYNVPVINYNGPFNGIANAVVNTKGGANTTPFFAPTNTGTGTLNEFSSQQLTAAGYAILTMEAQTAIATLNSQPSWLYLQDLLTGGNECGEACENLPNVNTVSPGNSVQFYSVIGYANGTSGVGFNTNFLTGTIGTWTSSNPAVGLVNQYGFFQAFSPGQTTVKLTLPNGTWNEWIMTVGPIIYG
jgi:hypothetical protein